MTRNHLPSVCLVLAVLMALGAASALAQGLAAPRAPALSTSTRPLPPTVVADLLKQIADDGRDSSLPPAIAATLQLTTGGDAWPNRQFTVRSQTTGAVHAAAIGLKPDSDLILSNWGDAAITVFRVRRDGSLVSASYYFAETQSGATVLPAEAARAFDDERAFWLRTLEAMAATK